MEDKVYSLRYEEPYDGLCMHNRLSKHAPHMYNQPAGYIVNTW